MTVGIGGMMSLGGVRVMSVRIVRVLRAGGFRFMRNFLVGARDRFVAKRIAAEQRFETASRNARQPKHHTSRRNDAESERKFWLAVSHAFNPLLASS